MGIFRQFPYSNFHDMNMDTIIEIVRQLQDAWAATSTEWASYKEFIDNYFENLDVSEEVLAALRIFADDGTLNRIMDPTIANETAYWLSTHITPTSPAVDSSLTVQGAAADAKVTGDYIRDIIAKYFTYYPNNVNDNQLSILNVVKVADFPKGKAYSLVGVTALADMPPKLAAPYNGCMVAFNASGWSLYIYVASTGQTFYGTDANGVMRWDNSDDALFQKYPYPLTNTQLSILGVTGVGELPRNRSYSLQGNNGNLTDMPAGFSGNYYGNLTIFDSAGWPLMIYVTNDGIPYLGTASGTTMRWYGSFEDLFKKFPYNINDNQLSILGITYVPDFPKNRIYSLAGVTTLQGMPVDLDPPYNGALMCFESSGWPVYIYVTNMGKTYTGTSVGDTMRWDYQSTVTTDFQTIEKRLAGLYGANVTLLGDSITWGSHLTDSANGTRLIINKGGTDYYNNVSTTVWSYKLAQYLYQNYRVAVTNNSFPGCSFNDVVNNLSTLIPANAHFVLVLLGTNNQSDPSQVASMMNTIQAYCENNGKQVVFMQPLPTTDYVTQMMKVRGQIKQNNKEIGDCYSEYNNMLFQMHVPLSNLMYDDVHPNDAAQPYILETVKKVLHL